MSMSEVTRDRDNNPPQPPADVHERAAQQVAMHHDKAGLAERFRVDTREFEVLQVDTVDAAELPVDAFWQRYVARNMPVVVLNAMAETHGWAPGLDWSQAALKAAVGHAQIRVRAVPQQGGVFGDVAKLSTSSPHIYQYEQMRLADFLDATQREPVPYYAARLELQEDLPELIPEIPSHWGLPWRRAFGQPYSMGTVAYLGAARQATPLHYDDVENLLFVARGTKHLVIYPPSQSPNLYPAPQRLGTHYSVAPPAAFATGTGEPPHVEGFPLLQRACGVSVTVPAGAMLYLPCCWWHSVRGGREFNVSFNYWFAQSPKKEDGAIYRKHLEEEVSRWMRQLGTMDLPASVMREAHDEAPLMMDHKAKLREAFSWDDTS